VCTSNGTYSGSFYLIKGDDNFARWEDDHTISTMDSFDLNATCGSQNNTRNYSIQEEDYYYMVFYVDFDYNYYDYLLDLDFSMVFNRTRYEVADNSSAIDSCSVNDLIDSCTVSVPLTGSTAFLTVTPQPDTEVDWINDEMDLDTLCVARVWMYVVIALSIIIGLVVILVPLLVCLIVKLRKMSNATPPTVTPVVDDNAPLLASPPTNPHLQQPVYGSNYVAPPIYKP
jgi:hypothetical protein